MVTFPSRDLGFREATDKIIDFLSFFFNIYVFFRARDGAEGENIQAVGADSR